MRISEELKIWIGVLVSVQVLLALGAIELLTRMSPAIERIMQDNVPSIAAVEEMLAALALNEISEEERQAKVAAALAQARNSLTEPGEAQVLDEIEAFQRRFFAGDREVQANLIERLRRLSEINQESMRRADERARRLGVASAWAAVLLGFCGFWVSLLAISRMRRRFLRPLAELHEVLQAFRAGEQFRRCSLREQPPEFEEIGTAVNRLLDDHWSRDVERRMELAALDRAALLYLIDAHPEPVVILDRLGNISALNPAARQLVEGEDGRHLRQLFVRLAHRPEERPEEMQIVELPGRGWFCFLPQARQS